MEILFCNRKKNEVQKEKVYSVGFLNWLYNSTSGKFLNFIFVRRSFSRFYGFLQSRPSSSKKILPFVKEFNINLDDFKITGNSECPYKSFNEFFIREYKDGKRIFKNGNFLSCFAEGRYLGFERILETEKVPVKGKFLSPSRIICNDKWGSIFENGPLLIARLCPVDYHRFHFPCDGKIIDEYRISGEFHSVNPMALKIKQDIFIENERHVTILDSLEYGKLAYIEVGALSVGKIVQSYKEDEFVRGQEKGYFLFGGSTVLIFGEPSRWTPSTDILENTQNGLETLIELGDEVATRNSL